MKRIGFIVLIALLAMALITPLALADLQLQSNGTNVGIITKLNVKGATTTRSGEIGLIDGTAMAITSGTISGVAITGSTLNNSVIGGVTPAAATFTTVNSTTSTSTGSTLFQTNVVASGFIPGVTQMPSTTPTRVGGAWLSFSLVQKTVDSPSDEAGQIDDGTKVGQMITLQLITKTGTGNWVVTPLTKTGFTTLTFTAAKQSVTLRWDGASTGWIIVGNAGVTIA